MKRFMRYAAAILIAILLGIGSAFGLIILISAAREGNWLPSAGGRRFTLTVRLYNPDPHAAVAEVFSLL